MRRTPGVSVIPTNLSELLALLKKISFHVVIKYWGLTVNWQMAKILTDNWQIA